MKTYTWRAVTGLMPTRTLSRVAYLLLAATAALLAILMLGIRDTEATHALGDTVVLSGTFNAESVFGNGPESNLTSIIGHDNGYIVTFSGVTFENFGGLDEKGTRLKATSFDFQFNGVDENFLNTQAGQFFSQGGFQSGGFLEVTTEFGSHEVYFYIQPPDPSNGVYLEIYGTPPDGTFQDDANGYPIIGPFSIDTNETIFHDTRDGRGFANFSGALANSDTMTLAPPSTVASCNGQEATIEGTENGDTIIGTPGDDVIVGLAGNDIILAGCGKRARRTDVVGGASSSPTISVIS